MNTETAIAAAQAARAEKEALAAENARKAEDARKTLLATDSGFRAYDRFLNMTGKRAVKSNEITKATLKAMGENLHHWLEHQPEDLCAEVFTAMEFGATQADAKRIAKHPLRPAIVTEMVAIKAAEAKAAKEAQALADAAEAARKADDNDTPEDA
ncbi:hypothetical protein [Roseobacter sp. GAI101]|uniref:hypothetical protein n=1 Tax=Roseobacter sp. (strain GAI101) TaxID=391589 RepID=UPI0018DC0D6B|nr:hypothetical protein [Roseobacter sp. GAI101]